MISSLLQKTVESINTDVKQGKAVVVRIQTPCNDVSSSPSAEVSAVTTATLPGSSYVMPTDIYCPEKEEEKP